MIKKITLENYRGIGNKREINFVANGKRQNTINNKEWNKPGVAKMLKHEVLLAVALMGKNASGKSSFIDGIDFATTLIHGNMYKRIVRYIERMHRFSERGNASSLKIEFEDVMSWLRNSDFHNKDKPIVVGFEFIDESSIISIEVELNPDGKVNERIMKNNKVFKEIQGVMLDEYRTNVFDENLRRRRILFMSDFFIYDEMHPRSLDWDEMIKEVDDIKERVEDWMRIADDKIVRIIWTSKNVIESFVIHDLEYNEKIITVNELSSGTKKWLSISMEVFRSLFLENAFIYIDEMDRALHPFLATFLIMLFNDVEINKKQSQLLFTSHNPIIVERPFRKDAINYIDRTGEIVNLGELGTREDYSVVKNFISEKLGSHPSRSDMYEFLKGWDE